MPDSGNRMSNKRIDLTQFEGNEKGWMYDVEGIGAHPKNYFEEVEEEFKDSGVKTKPLHLSNQEVNAITLLPELITELKRCYEKIDKMDEAILSARELLMSYFDAVTLSDDEAAQEILDVVKELRKTSE